MTKVIDSVDFGPGIPCTHDSDLNELMRTIYAYFCYKGYPADLQANIDKVIQIFSKGDCSPADIECLMLCLQLICGPFLKVSVPAESSRLEISLICILSF